MDDAGEAEKIEEIAARFRPAINWLNSAPDEETLQAALTLCFLRSRGAVSEETRVSNEELDKFADHVHRVLVDVLCLGMVATGALACECSGDEPRYWVSEQGREMVECHKGITRRISGGDRGRTMTHEPAEWTSRACWVDPPSGWRYGFPRLYDPATDGDMTEWMIANGYPEQLARQGVVCTFTAERESESPRAETP